MTTELKKKGNKTFFYNHFILAFKIKNIKKKKKKKKNDNNVQGIIVEVKWNPSTGSLIVIIPVKGFFRLFVSMTASFEYSITLVP